MAKLRAAALAMLIVLFALLIASNFTPSVKADTATALTLSITPSTVEHSSRYQLAAVSTFQMSLTASGTGLASKPVYLYYRAVGSSSWINFYLETTDSNGQIIITSFSIENAVAKGTGDFEFKAEYVPIGADIGVYAGSTTTVTVTVTPHVPKATTITISITPSTFEHSSGSQPAATEDLLVTLSVGGNPLPKKEVIINWHPVGASYWNIFDEELTDASGQIAYSSVNLEGLVHTSGTYEFRAFYNPYLLAEETDYSSSEATCTVTMQNAASDQSTITINNHQGSGSHLSTSGVTVTTTDSTLPNGYTLSFTTIKYGSTLPPSTTTFSVSGNIYYDVQLVPVPSGSLGSDVLTTVQITDSSFLPSSVIYCWTGSSWQPIASTYISLNTISFTVEASMLDGTPFVVHQASIIPTPEYPLSAILAVGACFFAVATFKLAKKPTVHFSFPFSR